MPKTDSVAKTLALIEDCLDGGQPTQLRAASQMLRALLLDARELAPNQTVDHPAHYNQYPMECIEVLRVLLTADEFRGFCLGNAVKYRWRAGCKPGSPVETDLDKAAWYEERARKDTAVVVGEGGIRRLRPGVSTKPPEDQKQAPEALVQGRSCDGCLVEDGGCSATEDEMCGRLTTIEHQRRERASGRLRQPCPRTYGRWTHHSWCVLDPGHTGSCEYVVCPTCPQPIRHSGRCTGV